MKYKKLTNWIPKNEGDAVEGKIISIEEDVGEHKIKVYNLETENDVKEVHGATVLDKKLNSICALGAHIKIVYLGMKQGTKEYKDFDVYLGCQE